jgi:hypothetical protein
VAAAYIEAAQIQVDDIDAAPQAVDGVEKEHVAAVFRNQSWTYVVWIPDWLLEESGDDRDIETLENSDHLAVGDVSDYSDKAWRFSQPHRKGDPGGYLPKSQVVVFERMDGLDDLDTPQKGLTDYANDD